MTKPNETELPIFSAPDTNRVAGHLENRTVTFDPGEGLPSHDEMPRGIRYRPLEVEERDDGTEVVSKAEILGFALFPNDE